MDLWKLKMILEILQICLTVTSVYLFVISAYTGEGVTLAGLYVLFNCYITYQHNSTFHDLLDKWRQ